MQEYYHNGLYYRKNDFEADRPTIVFVHGLSGSSSAWLTYEKAFDGKYNMVSIDLRGHGKSMKPAAYEEYAMENFIGDIHALIVSQGIRKFVFVSHSFATLIILGYLEKYPGDAAASIFLSPSFDVGRALSSKILKPFLSLTPIFKLLPFSAKPGGHIDYSKHVKTGDWNIRRMIADVGNTTMRVYVYCTKQSYTVDAEEFLQHIDIPTLMIHGKDDSIFPVRNSIHMSEKIRDSKLILIPHADHIIALNNVPEICGYIESFIDQNRNLL